MKKKNILLLLLIALFPITAQAASMEIKCSSTSITVGDSVRCTVIAKEQAIGGVQGNVEITNGTVTSTEKKACAFGDLYVKDENTGKMTLSCVLELDKNSADVAVYTLKSSKVGTMTFKISDAVVINGNFDSINVASPSVNITVKEPVTQAPSRPVTPAPQPQTEAPTQAPQQNETSTVAPATETPTEAQTEAPTEGTTVTEATKDTKLERLNIEGVTFTFQSDKLEYNIEVPNSVEELKIDYKTFNPNAVVEVSTTKLVDGMNNIEVKVTYEGVTSVYKLNIKRIPAKSPKTDSTKIIKLVVSLIGMVGLSFLLIIVIKK